MLTIDARWLNSSGIGTYLRNVLPGVICNLRDINFSIIIDKNTNIPTNLFNSPRVTIIEAKSSMYSIYEQFEISNKIPKNTKLFWATHYNIPLLYDGLMLVTIYDLFHLAMPSLVGGIHKRLYAKAMFEAVRYKAKAIIAISYFTKNELDRLTPKGKQPVFPIHLGIDNAWFNIKKEVNPRGKAYLLYVGNVKPHKNLGALIRAFKLLIDKIPHELVIVGKKEGFITGDKDVISLALNLNERIHFTGYIEDKMLKQYFTHADAFIFPSIYEGFGLPPLEGMAAGCPVLVSNGASLPEVCCKAAVYFDPYNHNDIANKIFKVINDNSLKQNMKKLGIEHARKFTWEKCINKTCEVISRML